MEFLASYPQRENLYFLTPATDRFEALYLQVREREGRLYPDELVRQLPQLPTQHPHHREWHLRRWNTQRLLDRLATEGPERLLDLGCGNGWLSHQLAARTGASVLGVDVNAHELRQAARLFRSDRCQFAYGDIFEAHWPTDYFDVIVLDSCLQYFPDLDRLIPRLRALLGDGGRIHILDSPIYHAAGLPAARQRSRAYYQAQEVDEMTQHYFHHTWEALAPYQAEVLHQPESWTAKLSRRLRGRGTPFPWLLIKDQA